MTDCRPDGRFVGVVLRGVYFSVAGGEGGEAGLDAGLWGREVAVEEGSCQSGAKKK